MKTTSTVGGLLPGRGLWADGFGRAATRAAQFILVLIALSVAIYGLVQLKLIVIPLMVALILAAALSPVVAFLRGKGLPGALATWITFLAAILVLGGLVTGIVFAVRSEWDELVTAAGDGFGELQRFIASGPLPIDQEMIDRASEAVTSFATSSRFGAGALVGISTAAEVLTGALLGAVVLFYFLKDGGRIWDFFLRPFPGAIRNRLRCSGARTLVVLGQYVRGTAIIALIEGVVVGTALFILRVPLALPLAAIVFLGAFIPMVGATVAGILAALVALVANGPVAALVVVAIVVGINQLDGHVLQPVVMGRSLHLHGLVILLALAAGVILAGLIGAVLAVPLAAVTWAIIQVWTQPDPVAGLDVAVGAGPPPGPAEAAGHRPQGSGGPKNPEDDPRR
ncbi:AI-2E family transporter [Paeniglutamicibacter psychrophenolicus]|uniref:AI-2E family transporter n=1 Tax=Paeniglutamicibacter psychrophenolicus TaxID=257454 RepID=UPI0027875A20|nr:AI-2E family transporter [Paeniglutamicibacter psychrophenolicus]MDQ0092764.1 putative PurR-regulated permease PerM [Paeniglutamicibacter psychrophenolicus]